MSTDRDPPSISASSLTIGMLIGAAIGAGLWAVTGAFTWFPTFLGLGVVFALIIQSARNRAG